MTFNSKINITSNGKILHLNKYDHQLVECPICNQEIQPYWESRYNGIRAKCDECGVNWAES
ncbi:hypothetical protein C5F50_10580 [Nitrosopumilus ureiphilus]|uniref:Uncharacterized protein n=1 Tax=Nitrosopumilus ureiphilus TaxID=1470067 RepID=A0A7D5RH14_9ARCH|nr:hypothetical protein C5F50_10580 [Nitrosopumilus ureiphilus]